MYLSLNMTNISHPQGAVKGGCDKNISCSGPGQIFRKLPLAFCGEMRIMVLSQPNIVFRAGCKSPPEVKSSSGVPHEPV